MSPLTIAITGAAGRIGSATCQAALNAGHTVIGIDVAKEGVLPAHPAYTYKSADLTVHAQFKAVVEGCNAIIHLAAAFSKRALDDPEGEWIIKVPEHVVHNVNTSASWNALDIAGELGITRVVLASSVNSIGMIFSERPRFDYIPLDENHPFYPEDAYSVCKQVVEIQSDAFARKYPAMRIASLRFHWTVDDELAADPVAMSKVGGNWKDLWGWVSISAVTRACLLGLTAPEETFPKGHETFYIVGPTSVRRENSLEVLHQFYPEITDVRREFRSNEGFFDCSKAEKMLGWTETGQLYT